MNEALKPWWGKLVELVVVSVCTVGVLLAMATTPSLDEFTKGLAAAFLSVLATQVTGLTRIK